MKSREARLMGVPTVPLTDLYSAASDFIVAHAGEVRLRNAIESFQPTECGVRVKVQGSEEDFEYVVLAVPFDSLAKLLPDSTESAELREKVSYFETSPITGVHFWFDREITDLPHAVLLERTIQWMFHKSLLLHPPSSQAQQDHSFLSDAADLEPRYDYLELVISSSKALINKSRQEVIDLALAELREFFPAASAANLVKATVIKEVNATFSPTPGIDAYRPPAQTRWPRIFLAGDWTATGWPATMEGAVRSGYRAAEAITQTCGRGKEFLVADLPPGGFMRFR